MRADQIIVEPVLTEKTNLLREEEKKKYVFKVAVSCNKIQVKQAVKEIFSVDVESCNILSVKGKGKVVVARSGHKRGTGKTSSWKKAIVTLKAGQKIDVFEGA